MPKSISDIAVKELSLIFGEHKGEKWSPINAEARVLAVKSKPLSFLNQFVERIKAGWPVSADVPDNVDHDGDGADDYNDLAAVLGTAYYDLQTACSISDEQARSVAVCAVLDNFKANLDAIYGAAKAGARHSKADVASMKEIADHTDGIRQALDDLGVENNANADNAGDADTDMEDTQDEEKARAIVEAAKASDNLCEDGLPTQFNLEFEGKAYRIKGDAFDKLIAVAKADKKKSDEPYGEVKYADPGYQEDKKKRYPLDNKKHAKAAWSYINMPKNADKYSSDDLAKVKAKIKAACKKFGIEISDDSGKGAVVELYGGIAPIDMQSVVDAAVAKAKGAFETQTDEKIKSSVDAAKAESEGQIASLRSELEIAKAHTDKAKVDADAANAAIKAMVKDATKPGSPGFIPTRQENGEIVDPAKEAADKAAVQNPTSIAEAIRLQRLVQS